MDTRRPPAIVLPTALLALALLLTGCTPPPVSTGPRPCDAWDFVERCDGWVRPVRDQVRRFDRHPGGDYDLYLDPDGFYEKYVRDRLVGTGEFWIACAGTGDCRDDELLFLSGAGIEWELFIHELSCSPGYDDPYDPLPPILVPNPLPGPPPSTPLGKGDDDAPVYKEPDRRTREGGEPQERRKGVRRSERVKETPQPQPTPQDSSRVKEPRGKSKSSGGGR